MKLYVLGIVFVIVYYISVFIIYFVNGEDVKGSYGPVIRDIYDKSGATEVIAIQTTPQHSFETFTILQDIYVTMSHDSISVAIIKLETFSERPTYHVERALRPLVLITISKMTAVHAIGRLVPKLNMYDPVWLIIFVEEPDLDVCRYCRAPYENLLRLDRFSKILVWCCKMNLIGRWISEDERNTHKQLVARWVNEERRMEWFKDISNDGTSYSLHGRGLRVVIVPRVLHGIIFQRSNYVRLENGKLAGFLGDVIGELSSMLHFTVASVIMEDSYGKSATDESPASGVRAIFEQDKADVAFGPFLMTGDRRNEVDFTMPIVTGRTYLYFKKTQSFWVHWDTHFKVFSPYIWNSIIAMILILPFFLTLIRYHPRIYHFLPLMFEHYLNVWGIYCQQGLDAFPYGTPLKVLYVSILLSALVISAAYSGCLISHLAVPATALPFNTLEEFVRDGTYQLIVIKDSADNDLFRKTTNPVLKSMVKLLKPYEMLPTNFSEGFKQVCNEQVAFYASEVLEMSFRDQITCELARIDGGREDTFGLILPKYSVYTEFLDFYIQQLKDIGLLKYLLAKHFSKKVDIELNSPEANFTEVLTLFLILIGGVVTAVVICVMEKMVFFRSRKSKEERRRENLKKKMRSSRLPQGSRILRTSKFLRN